MPTLPTPRVPTGTRAVSTTKVEAYEQTVTALGRQLQAAADAKAAGEADLPAFLTQVNDQMAKAAIEEGTKLLGDCVKEAFLNEHLQF